MKIYKKILLITILWILLAINISFAKSGTVIVDAARIREQANTESKIIDIVYEDDVVEILEEKEDWYKIKYNNSVGYSKKSFFKVDGKQDSTPATNTTSGSKNNTSTNTQTNTALASSNNIVNNTVANVTSRNTVVNNTVNNTSTNTANTVSSNKTTNNEIAPTTTSSQNTIQINSKVTVNSNVAMRAIPNFMSTAIEQITPGKELTKVAEINNWSQVTDGVLTGWIQNAKIVAQDNAVPTPEAQGTENKTETEAQPKTEPSTPNNEIKETAVNKTGTVNVETANVRQSASQNSDVVNTLDYGNSVTITAEEGDWYKITSGSISGYVKKSLLTNVKERNVSSRGLSEERTDNTTVDEESNKAINQAMLAEMKEDTNGKDVAEYAKQYIGTNYVVGGKNPKSGFDCSGFTRYIFLNFGYNLGNTAANQDNIGEDVSKENLQAGDLMLFYDEDKNKIGHTGVYISNGEFVHAANPERGVVTDNLNTNTYYNERFIVGKRIVK